MVQRYRPDSDEQGRSFEMIPDDGGDYVAYEDYEELEAEVGRLQMMNPCNHTGFESAPCDVCGYPDPRKMITKLKDERDALKADNERLREALRYIAFTIPGPTMKTHAEAAQQALQGGGNESL